MCVLMLEQEIKVLEREGVKKSEEIKAVPLISKFSRDLKINAQPAFGPEVGSHESKMKLWTR